jgi:hypothetical protein
MESCESKCFTDLNRVLSKAETLHSQNEIIYQRRAESTGSLGSLG